jgi:hypothetical protein
MYSDLSAFAVRSIPDLVVYGNVIPFAPSEPISSPIIPYIDAINPVAKITPSIVLFILLGLLIKVIRLLFLKRKMLQGMQTIV